MDDKGELATDTATWQFNFKFSLGGDMFAQDSIELLKSSGLQFERHEHDGIDPTLFAEVIMTSGLVLNEDVTWLSFHSGYDLGHLLKLLTNTNLPQVEGEFFELLRIYFPKVYDVKYLMKSCRYLKGGLQEVADQLEVRRIGPQHQAGSDSLLTGLTFFRMKEMFFEDNMDESRYCGYLYGLGLSYTNGDGGFVGAARCRLTSLSTGAAKSSRGRAVGTRLQVGQRANRPPVVPLPRLALPHPLPRVSEPQSHLTQELPLDRALLQGRAGLLRIVRWMQIPHLPARPVQVKRMRLTKMELIRTAVKMVVKPPLLKMW